MPLSKFLNRPTPSKVGNSVRGWGAQRARAPVRCGPLVKNFRLTWPPGSQQPIDIPANSAKEQEDQGGGDCGRKALLLCRRPGSGGSRSCGRRCRRAGRIDGCRGRDRLRKPLQVFFYWWLPGVDPVRRGDEQLQRPRGHHLAHSNGKDRLPLADRPLDLALDEDQFVGILGEDQHEHRARTRSRPRFPTSTRGQA